MSKFLTSVSAESIALNTGKFRRFYFSMPRQERKRYAAQAGTSEQYIHYRLLNFDKPHRRTPSEDLMNKLALASKGAVTFEDVVTGIFIDPRYISGEEEKQAA